MKFPATRSVPLVRVPEVLAPPNVAAPFTISESSAAFMTSAPEEVVWNAPPTTSVVALRLRLPLLTVTLPSVVDRAAGLLFAVKVRFGRLPPTKVFVLPVSRKPPDVAVTAVPPSRLPATVITFAPSDSGTAAMIVRSFTLAPAASAGANVVPLGTNTLSAAPGAPAGFQFVAVVKLVLVTPIHVRVVPVGMPYAAKLAGVPIPAAVAVATFGPTAPPTVNDVRTRPFRSVTPLGAPVLPPPSAIPHVTVSPLTALPNASVTLATRLTGSSVLIAPLCVLPLSTTTSDAAPALSAKPFVAVRVPSENDRV